MVNRKLLFLVVELAEQYASRINSSKIPVDIDVLPALFHDMQIEVRMVPLKSMHGAVWGLKDAWVIHLNNKDSSARRRFTFFHEIFHVLAHCNGEPVFKKMNNSQDSVFNEMLADYFAGIIVLPRAMLIKKWREIKDIRKMASVFDVPETVMYCGLKWMKLI
jgi:Zn-dependent peptidase ImmA (M78 family)